MSLQQTFIANLRYFRKKKGLTQKDLSVYLNKGCNYINCIAGGNSFPPPDVIDQMAAILEVAPGLLFQKGSSPENLRRYGGCTHSGFGMGFERLVLYLTDIENIRDVIPYPRTPGNCAF